MKKLRGEGEQYIKVEWPVVIQVIKTRSGDGVSWEYDYEIQDFYEPVSYSELEEIYNDALRGDV
jgi:hypothetical protein